MGPSWRRESSDSKDDDLTEQAIAGWGDWNPKVDRVVSKTIRSLNADFEKIDVVTIKSVLFDIYKHKTQDDFLLGKMSELQAEVFFEVLFKIELRHQKRIEVAFKNHYKNLMNVDGVMTRYDMRGATIGRFMYQYLVDKMHYTILGDEIQYAKARLLWARLSKMDDCIVDIIDIEDDKIIERNVELYHGEADHEFDERVWSYDTIKKHIRLVLTKVK